jgi:hypothetical protein
MKTQKVTIQTNDFLAIQTPDTQEDNHHGIKERWDLFQSIGDFDKTIAGKLVQYYNGNYAVFHSGSIRYDIPNHQVIFQI